MKLKLLLLTALAILLVPVSVHAANFSVRLGQPKTPTNQNSLKLTFVAGTTDPNLVITVQCFKKGPLDGGFSQFDTDKVMVPGGNTDQCDVTSSILSTPGSYSFYVVGTAGSSVQSSTVTVDYNNSGPSTPNSYSKERLNSCDYKIRFKTADDAKTIKVQLFRSDTLSISVGSSSVLTSQNISPNTWGEFIDSVPTCGKDYYYVLRAVDSSDNASGTIGDSFTTTTTSTSTTTGTTTVGTVGQAGSTGAIALDGQVSQVSDPSTASSTGSADTEVINGTSETGTPSILGTSTEDKKGLSSWLQGLIAGFVIYIVFRSFRKKRSK